MENNVQNVEAAGGSKFAAMLREKLLLVWKGVIRENPTFVLVLGMCPTLGTTTSAANGFGMGAATMAVLIMSNVVISLIKNLIPDKVRIPAFIVVIASFVTVIQMLMQAYVPSLYASLGVFIPLIVVNCIILGRAEAFASKNGAFDSALDGVGIGLGSTLSLTVIGAVREILGSGSIFGVSLGIGDYMPLVFVLAPGGFLVLGFLMVLFNKFAKKQAMEISYFAIIIGAIFVNNVVLAQFLGICPFLGVSSKVETSLGMGAAVTFVMALSSLVVWLIQTYILAPLGIEYMQTIVFILVIAALVQMVEIILKKVSPSLYQALGIFLPLITTNCAVLGVAILMIQKEFNLLQSVVYSVSTAIGFALALVIFAGLRERLEFEEVPKAFRGVPIALITASLLAMAFMGFSGMV